MTGFLESLQPGTVPGWITAFCSTSGLAVVTGFYLRVRKLKLEEKVVDREGYGDIIDRQETQMKAMASKVAVLEQAEQARDLKVAALTIRVGQLNAALRVAVDKLAEEAPNSPELRLVRSIMRSLYPVEGLEDDQELTDLAGKLRGVDYPKELS